MPKRIDKEKELKFIEYYTEGETAGNASKSAQKAGWTEDSRQMGYYLKNKYVAEIKQKPQFDTLQEATQYLDAIQEEIAQKQKKTD